MNKTRIMFISILVAIVALFLLGMFLTVTSEDRAKRRAVRASEKEAEEVTKKKDFINIDVDKYLKLYEGDKKSVVLIGRSDCDYCQIAEPILHGLAYTYDLDIYYLSTDGFSEEDKSNLLNSDEYFQKSEGMPTPLLLIVKKSKIVAKVEGLADKNSYIDFFDNNNII